MLAYFRNILTLLADVLEMLNDNKVIPPIGDAASSLLDAMNSQWAEIILIRKEWTIFKY